MICKGGWERDARGLDEVSVSLHLVVVALGKCIWSTQRYAESTHPLHALSQTPYFPSPSPLTSHFPPPPPPSHHHRSTNDLSPPLHLPPATMSRHCLIALSHRPCLTPYSPKRRLTSLSRTDVPYRIVQLAFVPIPLSPSGGERRHVPPLSLIWAWQGRKLQRPVWIGVEG